MSILSFTDADGDAVRIESAFIVSLRVGHVEGRGLFTIITTVGGSLVVREQLADVETMWRQARADGGPSGFHGWPGWPVNWLEPHPSIVKPSGPPPWAAKTGGAK